MNSPIKIIAIIAAALAFLVLMIGILVPAFVEVDGYRRVIVDVVQNRTGRNFEIKGNFSIDALPCCSLILEDIRLGNPPEFEDGDFVTVDEIRIYPRLWPVITRREIVIGDIVLHGLEINAMRVADGSVNWQLSPPPRQATQEIPPVSEETDSGDRISTDNRATVATTRPAMSVAGMRLNTRFMPSIKLRNTRASFQDAANGLNLQVEDIELATNSFEIGQPFDMDLALQLQDISGGTVVQVELNTQVHLNPTAKTISLADFHADGDVRRRGSKVAELSGSVEADSIDYDINIGSGKFSKLWADANFRNSDAELFFFSLQTDSLEFFKKPGNEGIGSFSIRQDSADVILNVGGSGVFSEQQSNLSDAIALVLNQVPDKYANLVRRSGLFSDDQRMTPSSKSGIDRGTDPLPEPK